MGKFTNFVLIFALLVAGVGGVNAKTLNVNLSNLSPSEGTATWDSDTNTFAWTGTYSNAITLPGIPSNMSEYTIVNWTATAGTMDHFRILVYYSNGALQTTYNPMSDMTGSKSVTFADMGVVAANLAYISSIKISGASDGTGDIVISAFSFTGPDVVPIEASEVYKAPTGTTDLNGMMGAGNNKWNIAYPKEVAPQGEFAVGNLDTDNKSVNITSYDYLQFVVTRVDAGKKISLRVFVSEESLSDNSKRHCLYPRPIADVAGISNWEEVYYITEPGTYAVKISDYPLLRGVKAGNGYSGDESNGTITISQSYLSSGNPVVYQSTGEYVIIGKDNTSSASLTTALADASATYYDATGMTGTDVDLTTVANPNALFKANSGVLTNTKNVIVGGVCANLELTDDKPFKAPAAFTSTAAPTYDRAFTASTTTTVCLPFALTAAEATTLGTFYELSSFDGSTLRFTSVDAPVANKAYLVKTKAADPALTLSETEKSIVATPADLGTAVTNVDFIGTLESTVIPASGDDYSYYAYNNGSLVKIVTNAATLPAFRGYFKVKKSGISTARSLNISFDNEATGISAALMNSDERTVRSEVYNLNGQRVAAPQKGLYIVNGKKAIVK